MEIHPTMKRSIHNISPWIIPAIETNTSLLNYSQGKSNLSMLKLLVQELEETFSNHIHIYTDGFQTPNGSGYAVTGNRLNNSTKFHPKTPILHCELNAIKHAIELTSIDQNKNFTIFCDCINAISSIQSPQTNDPIIQECQKLYIKSTNRNNTVILIWVLAHIGNVGNERAEKNWPKKLPTPTTTTIAYQKKPHSTCSKRK